jgi:hypothetical protein
LGHPVKNLIDDEKEQGSYSIVWEETHYPNVIKLSENIRNNLTPAPLLSKERGKSIDFIAGAVQKVQKMSP